MWEGVTQAHLWAALSAPFCVLFAVRAANAANVAGVQPLSRGLDMWWSAMLACAVALIALSARSEREALAAAIMLPALVYFAVFDVRFLAIPVAPIIGLAVVGLGFAAADGGWMKAAWNFGAALAGWSALRAIDLGYQYLRGRNGLGAGDALIAAMIGAWLSFDGMAWSVAIGAVVSLIWALATRHAPERPLPFAPGLVSGAFACVLVRVFWGQG
jgi:leader peptidase (prepilin peptidase) / N-methyltransferase